jgi:rod shape determining protein RodA
MRKFFINIDWLLIFLSFLFSCFSLLAIASVSPDYLFGQIIFFLVGFLLLFIFSKIDYHYFEKYRWFLFFLSCFLVLITFFLGSERKGSVRWINIFGASFQPSEILKPLIIIYFASFLNKAGALTTKKIITTSFFVFLPVFFVFLQPDLGTSFVIFFIWIAIVFASGISWPLLTGFLVFLSFSIPLFWKILKDYQKLRIISFLNPQADPLGSGYNLIQAVVAVGSGKFFGRGLGKGTQSHLEFLPEKHTDFIFASLAEEIGFLGCFVLIILIFLFLARILKISHQSKDRFGYLIGIGIFAMFFVQFVINISMNLGLAPITGITLPLISSGGSSILSMMISLGILINISSQGKRKGILEIK